MVNMIKWTHELNKGLNLPLDADSSFMSSINDITCQANHLSEYSFQIRANLPNTLNDINKFDLSLRYWKLKCDASSLKDRSETSLNISLTCICKLYK